MKTVDKCFYTTSDVFLTIFQYMHAVIYSRSAHGMEVTVSSYNSKPRQAYFEFHMHLDLKSSSKYLNVVGNC